MYVLIVFVSSIFATHLLIEVMNCNFLSYKIRYATIVYLPSAFATRFMAEVIHRQILFKRESLALLEIQKIQLKRVQSPLLFQMNKTKKLFENISFKKSVKLVNLHKIDSISNLSEEAGWTCFNFFKITTEIGLHISLEFTTYLLLLLATTYYIQAGGMNQFNQMQTTGTPYPKF